MKKHKGFNSEDGCKNLQGCLIQHENLQREINDKKKLQIQEERPEAVCGQLLGAGFVKEGQVGQVEEDLSISALFKSCKSF